MCLETPEWFFGVGQFYKDFHRVADAEVGDLLHRVTPAVPARAGAIDDDPPIRDEEVAIPVGMVRLAGRLTVPERAQGVIVFAHGSGSSRHSPRNRFVAEVLQRAGLATLLFDLLTPQEELNRANVFGIELLAGRLAEATRWVRRQPECAGLAVAYFGASAGSPCRCRTGPTWIGCVVPTAKIAAQLSLLYRLTARVYAFPGWLVVDASPADRNPSTS